MIDIGQLKLKNLEFTRDGNIAVLRLNRPTKRNALDADTIEELVDFFTAVPRSDVKAVLLTAAGEHFSAGLDLVEVSPNTEPPVCKILDFGKLKYQEQKKKTEARKKQRTATVKEIKMRPNIDTHDYEVKTKAMHRFFEEGDKVKVTIRFRGREMAHQDRGMTLLERVKVDFDEVAKVEFEPKLEGRQMIMVMAPR